MKKKKNSKVVVMGGDITIECAAALKDALIKALEDADNVLVDLKDVTGTDLSCLQLLCSAHRTSVNSKKTIALTPDYPEIFKEALQEAGYSRNFGCTLETENSCLWKGK